MIIICTIKTKKPKLVKSIVKVSGKKRKCDASAISVDQNKRKKTVKSVQHSSWEGFRYFPIDEEWQRSCCSQLNLNFYSTYKKSKGDGNTILTRPNMRTIKGIRGDGNCLFRALSFVLTGSQEQHSHVRSTMSPLALREYGLIILFISLFVRVLSIGVTMYVIDTSWKYPRLLLTHVIFLKNMN